MKKLLLLGGLRYLIPVIEAAKVSCLSPKEIDIAKWVLCLPLYYILTFEKVEKICDIIPEKILVQ